MAGETWPDVEGAMRTWLRAQTEVSAVVGTRVFFGLPDDMSEDEYPAIVVQRIGGGQVAGSEAPLDIALMQFDCWGARRRKDQAWNAAQAVRQVLNTLRSRTALTASVVVFGAEVDTVLFLPDSTDSRPRYVVQASVTALSA